ncbi:MAG: hypothetical protein JO316_10905 [Abitibacteriaceae bacterium]|nr:hypothetical protein [Abditibacteriaceae bacterium]MBV9865853.1 hypothetical protein [Abditibacteriaceae bacterium]
MHALFLQADAVLRGQTIATPSQHSQHRLWQLISCILCFGAFYGMAMGSRSIWPTPLSGAPKFHPAEADRVWLIFYSSLKVPLLLLVTFGLSVPSFFVLNTLSGLREDFSQALQSLMAAQAGLTVILAALSPFTLFWYASSASYQSAVLFNAFMFAVASVSSQYLLRRSYRPLIARHERHRLMLRLWLVLYGFIGIQMGWISRPFIGDPNSPAAFLRTESWGNAYVVLSSMIWKMLH